MLALVILVTVFITTLRADVVMMNSTTRLKGQISKDSLNRIAVTNDRITHVFGDQDAYEVVMDETIGQVFIKPTVSNGTKPISISFVTESQCTQDLLLTPSAIDAATLLYQNPSPHKKVAQEKPLMYGDMSPTQTDRVLRVMKQWVLSDDAYSDGTNPPIHHTYPGCTTELLVWKRCDGRVVSRWSVRNDTSTPLEITEDSFYQPGDQAIAVEKTTLEAEQSTLFYVVSQDLGYRDDTNGEAS